MLSLLFVAFDNLQFANSFTDPAATLLACINYQEDRVSVLQQAQRAEEQNL